jgi:glycosyltransferase involved in cell wall biosynthesis
LTAYFYSVTDDLLSQVLELESKFGSRVNYSTLRKPISHRQLEDIFAMSRIYIGCSISDGISTSFLEALMTGVYPIQTNTSCAGEWIGKGVSALLIEVNFESLLNGLEKTLEINGEQLDLITINNLKMVHSILSFEKIKKIALSFYNH